MIFFKFKGLQMLFIGQQLEKYANRIGGNGI
jgi:hypothetical protein